MQSLSTLPPEVQIALIHACLEPVRGLFSEDEREVMRRNRNVLKVLACVCQLWNAIATPLLYQAVVIEERALDRLSAVGDVQDRWPVQQRFVRTILSSPALAASVRALHYTRDRQWDPDAELHIPSLYEALAHLPKLEALSAFPAWPTLGRLNPFGFRLKSLAVELPPDYGTPDCNDLPLSSWFDTKTVTRLEIDGMGGTEGSLITDLLKQETWPQVVDLRIRSGEEWYTADQRKLQQGLQSLGPQLRTLHLYIGTLDDDEDDDDGDAPAIVVPALCPRLREFAFDSSIEAPGTYGTPSSWSDISLSVLILGGRGLPSTFDLRALADRSELPLPGMYFWPIRGSHPPLVAFSGLDATTWTEADWEEARDVAEAVWAVGRETVMEDRYGRVIERWASLAPALPHSASTTAA